MKSMILLMVLKTSSVCYRENLSEHFDFANIFVIDNDWNLISEFMGGVRGHKIL